MTIVSIAGAGIAAVLLAAWLKVQKSEYAGYLIMFCGFFIFSFGISRLQIVMQTWKKMEELIHLNHVYLEVLLKMTGITYVAEFASGICKDAGYGALGTQIEVFARLSVLAVSMPVLTALLDMLQGLVS